MDKALKQRMVGAVVLIALGVIFIPMLLDGGSRDDGRTVELDIPEPPDPEYRSRLLPLEENQAQPAPANEGRVSRGPTPSSTTESPGSEPESPPQRAQQPEPAEPDGEAVAEAPAEERRQSASTDEENDGAQASEAAEGSREGAGTPMGNWFVQVGSFSQQANAVDLRDRLRNAGYTAFVETSTVEGKTTHRVKVGPEMDRARSEKIRDDIQSRFDLKGIVVSEP